MKYIPRKHNNELRKIFTKYGWVVPADYKSNAVWAYSDKRKNGSRRIAFQAGWFRTTAQIRELVLDDVMKFIDDNDINATVYWWSTRHDYCTQSSKYDKFCVHMPVAGDTV